MMRCTIEKKDRIEIEIEIKREMRLRENKDSLKINRLRYGPRKNLWRLRDNRKIVIAIILLLHLQHKIKAE